LISPHFGHRKLIWMPSLVTPKTGTPSGLYLNNVC